MKPQRKLPSLNLRPAAEAPGAAASPSLAAISAATRSRRLVRIDEIAKVDIEYFPQPEEPAEPVPPGAPLRLVRLPDREDGSP